MLTQSDSIHKICGFSDGGLFHHKNSIRLGWSTEDGAIVLHSYIYRDGEREITRLMKVPYDSTVDVEMSVMGRKYMLKVNKTVYFLNRGATASCRYKHILYPYYGGKDTAPHDVIVNLNWEFPRKRWRI